MRHRENSAVRRIHRVGFLARRPRLELLEERQLLATFTVRSASDAGTDTLREAITNANAAGGINVIDFAITGGGVQTISLLSPLPSLDFPVTLNGYNQAGAQPNTLPEGTNAKLFVQVLGSNLTAAQGFGLVINAQGVVIDGLELSGFKGAAISDTKFGGNARITGNFLGPDASGTNQLAGGNAVAISLQTGGNTIGGAVAGTRNLISGNLTGILLTNPNGASTGSLIAGNLIGSASTGLTPIQNTDGIILSGGTTGNTIGGQATATRNLISANVTGLRIEGGNTTGNLVVGNYIGVDATGSAAMANLTGVLLSAPGNSIGGSSLVFRNVISGNTTNGILIDTSAAANPSANVVVGNYIGVNVLGTAAVANGVGVVIAGASAATIGGPASSLGNVISGNTGAGIAIGGTSASANVVLGNFVGTNPTGSMALPNGGAGVLIGSGSGHVIGGTLAAARNVISGNGGNGVEFQFPAVGGVAAANVTVQGNYIGTDATGSSSVANSVGGIQVTGAGHTIGGNTDGAGNLISGNNRSGISVDRSSGTLVAGNQIGTDAAGNAAILNGFYGVEATQALNLTVGGTTAGARNIISGNSLGGVTVATNPIGSGVLIAGNYVGTNRAGTAAIPNVGVGISAGAANGDISGVTIGGVTPGSGNLTSGNGSTGINFSSDGGAGNVIAGNLVGTDLTGQLALGNARGGIVLDAADVTVGGTVAGAANVISANGGGVPGLFGAGIFVDSTNHIATRNLIIGNIIGLSRGGQAALGNAGDGVELRSAPGNTIGGTLLSAANVIAANAGDGVSIRGAASSGNVVLGNFIGTNRNGLAGIGNKGSGVVIAGPGATVGGVGAEFRNVISGNAVDGVRVAVGGAGAVIAANYIGVTPIGTAGLANLVGVVLQDAGVTVGGDTAAAGNLISGNTTQGVLILTGGANAFLGGNVIGLSQNGLAAVPNGDSGVLVSSATGASIGGSDPASRNVISGNARDGIQFTGAGVSNSIVRSNYIGTDLSGANPAGNAVWGISIEGPSGVTIGGSASTPNVIAFNGNVLGGATGGVGITAAAGNSVRFNNIFQNVGTPNFGLGIDLNEDGVTPNDALDSDSGANTLQNYPVLTSALTGPNSTTVRGTLDSTPNTTFTIQFFANAAGDPSNFGEGQVFLGQSQPITTDNKGSATFTTIVPIRADAGQFLSAVATDPAGNSSEFAANVRVANAATDLALTIGAAPEPVQVGQNLVYTIVVTNNGPNGATGVTVTDVLPATVTYVPPVPAGNQSFSAGVVTANVGNLAAFASATVLITVTPNTPTAPGAPLLNTASVTSTEGDTDPSNNSATASSTVIASADLVLTVTTDPATPTGTPTPAGSILLGQSLTYVITVANPNGPNAAQNVVISDTVPSSFTIVSATSSQAVVTQNGQLVTGTIASLAPGASATITLRVKPTVVGPVFNNVATLSSDTADPSPANDGPVTVATRVLASADLAVTIAAGPTPFLNGQPYTYTVTAINNGLSDATNVSVVDTLPSSLTFRNFVLPAPAGVTLTQSGQTVTAVFANLPSGAMTQFQFVVAPSATGTISNTVVISGDPNGPVGDPDLSNNRATIGSTVAQAADLGVTVTALPNPVAVGSLLQYVVTVTNLGPDTASNVVATNTLPANVMFVSAAPSQGTFTVSGSTVTLSFASLATTRSATATITVRPLAAAAGTITDVVTVTGFEADPVSGNNVATVTSTVVPSADLALTLTGTPNPVLVGSNLTYTIVVSNNGPSLATGVSVQDSLPANVTVISVVTDGTFTQGKSGITVNPRPIAAGGSSTITIVVQPTTLALTNILNTASVSSAEGDPVPTNNVATVSTRVVPSSDLVLTVTDNPDPLLIGGNLTYTFTVTNNGPSDATNVSLSDLLPAGAVFIGSPPVPGIAVGISNDGTTFSASLGNLDIGATKSFTLIVRPTTTGQIENTATVIASQGDPDVASNTVNTFTTITPSADISVTVSSQPQTVLVGQPVTFSFNVVNQGPSDSAGVVLTAVIPTGVSVGTVLSNQGTITAVGQTVVLSLPVLASGSLATLSVTGMTTVVGSLVATGSVTSLVDDASTLNDTAFAAANVLAAADLAISETASANPAPLRSNLTYSILVTNNGPSDAHNVVLTDVLPAGAQFVSATLGDGSSFTPVAGVLTVPIGTLLNGQTALLTLVVSPTQTGTLNNTASVAATEADTAAANSTNVQLVTVSGIPGNVAFAAAGYVVDEKAGVATITVNRINGSDGPASVDVATGGGSAVPGVNYISTSASVFFADGQTTATFTVPILDDGRNTGDTVVGLVLSNPTGGVALASPSSAVLTIREGDVSGITNPTEAPLQVIGLKRFGIHNQPTRLVVAFNGQVSASSAQNPANYVVVFPGTGEVIPVTSAVYDANTSTVTLSMSRRLDIHKTFRITIRGTGAGAISTPGGNLLDGNRDNAPGGDYAAPINNGTLGSPTRTFKSRAVVSHKSASPSQVHAKRLTNWADHLKARMGGR